jgi:hypothetical protein
VGDLQHDCAYIEAAVKCGSALSPVEYIVRARVSDGKVERGKKEFSISAGIRDTIVDDSRFVGRLVGKCIEADFIVRYAEMYQHVRT